MLNERPALGKAVPREVVGSAAPDSGAGQPTPGLEPAHGPEKKRLRRILATKPNPATQMKGYPQSLLR